MRSIECTDYVYDKINSGLLVHLINARWEKIYEILLNNLLDDGVWNACDKAEKLIKENFKTPGKHDFRKISRANKILNIEKIIDEEGGIFIGDKQNKIIVESGLLTFIVFNSLTVDFAAFGFNCDKDLDEAIASYCIAKSHEYENYIWRHKNFKNEVWKDIHGDLHFTQSNLSANLKIERNLFGDFATYDICKTEDDGGSEGFGCYYNNWGIFLRITLAYIEHLGFKDAEFVKNWRNAFDQNRGTHTAECMTGSSDHEHAMLISNLFLHYNVPIIQNKGEERKKWTLSMGDNVNKRWVHPFIFKRKLYIGFEIKKEDLETVTPDAILNKVPVKGLIEYRPKDIPYLLEGILINYSRDRSEAVDIMEHFLHDKYGEYFRDIKKMFDKSKEK